MNATSDIRFAVIGGGLMGKAYSVALAALPMHVWPVPLNPVREIIVEATPALADDAARRFGFNRHMSDWRKAVEDPKVDAVIVLTPPHLHFDIVMAAIAAGKHIICEKPLSFDIEECRKMTEAAERAQLVTQVGFNWRLVPAVQMAKRLLDDGVFGDIVEFRGFWLMDIGWDPRVPFAWRHQKKLAGAGALLDTGSHVIDYARLLVDEFAEVIGFEKTHVTERPISGGEGVGKVDVDDNVTFLAKFRNAAQGSITAANCWHGKKVSSGFELSGTRGSAIFDWQHINDLQVYESSAPHDRRGFKTIIAGPDQPYGDIFWPVPAYGFGYSDSKIIQLFEFVRAAAGGQPVQSDLRGGLRAALVADAVIRSIADNRWTFVDKD